MKDAEGFALSREDMGPHFMNGGNLDFSQILDGGNPATKKTDTIFSIFQRRGNMFLNWDQPNLAHREERRGGRGPKTRKFTWPTFHAYLLSKYGPATAARLREAPHGQKNKDRPRAIFKRSTPFLKAYMIMCILGESRARVLSREVGSYPGGDYVPFSARRRDIPPPAYGRAHVRVHRKQRMKLARGEGLVSLLGGALGESFLQAGQTLADLDVEARVYYDAHQAGTLKDVFRQGIFDRFNPINAPKDVHDVHIQHVPASIPLPPLVAQVADPAPLPPQRPRLRGPLSVRKPPPKREKKKKRSFESMLSTAPGPHSAGPAAFVDLREGGSPSPDISNIPLPPLRHRSGSAVSLPPMRPGERPTIRVPKRKKRKPTAILASTDPQPEARVNPRANTEPPSFEPPPTPERPIMHQILESSPSFQSDSRAPTVSIGSVVDLPGFSSSPEIPDVPEPQILPHCPTPEFQHMKADLTFHPSAEPDVEIHGGVQPRGYAQFAIDLTENPPDPEVMSEVESLQVLPQKKSEDPGQDNTVLLLCGLVFVGLVVWLGNDEPSRRAVMPYY